VVGNSITNDISRIIDTETSAEDEEIKSNEETTDTTDNDDDIENNEIASNDEQNDDIR